MIAVLAATFLLNVKASAQEAVSFQNGLVAHTEWRQGPTLTPDESILQMQWTTADGQPVPAPGNLQVRPYMTEHGHGTSPVTLMEIRPGVTEVSKIYFSMPGLWEMRITVDSETQALPVLVGETCRSPK